MAPRRTLYDPTRELDSCGIGFLADARGRSSRTLVESLLEALRRVKHRGAVSADGKTGDGAGVLVPIPACLREGGSEGVAMVFLREESDREAVERACAAECIAVEAWRPVPVDEDALGEHARRTAPRIEQARLRAPDGLDADELERRAFRARRGAERDARARDGGLYVASLSFRTVTYKALCAADQLAAFYRDLRDPAFAAPFGIFHQRFSTNTEPTWERAQPFRLLCHNGEINAIQGNVNWMRAREGRLGTALGDPDSPVVDERGSDSAMLDNVLELLVRGGRDVRHGVTMLVPPAWQGDPDVPEGVRDFLRYHAGLVEPWDGPAGLVFSDGRVVGAALDRNGLRPLRVTVCEDGLVACASEAGVVDLDGRGQVWRSRLGPGQMIAVTPEAGVEEDGTIKRRLATRRPYGAWLGERRQQCTTGTPLEAPEGDLAARQFLFGYTREELLTILRPIAMHAHEPTSSMGDDAPIPPLAGRSRPLYGYFKQRFAQVTNPPIDHLRERATMSIDVLLGARPPILDEGPEGAEGCELQTFFLFPDALRELPFVRLDTTFTREEGLEGACRRLGDQAELATGGGGALLLLSDTDAGSGRAPIPALLATGYVHHRLVASGTRTGATIVVESDEPREVHHFACLIGYGAEAVCPHLALQSIAAMAAADKVGGDRPTPEEAQLRYRTAIEDGLLKVLSKMGISDVSSYCGAQIFEAIGLSQELVDAAFRGTPSALGGIGFADLEAEALRRLEHAAGRPRLEHPGYVKYRKGGEPHATNPDVVDAMHELAAAHALRKAVRGGGEPLYERFASLVNDRSPIEIRDLLEPVARDPIPLAEVEPATSIVRRFSSGGMSHGSLSAEAHETVAIAFNRLGARSNCGEGGEDPGRFRSERNSRIKQIASGRFGVTPEYASFADELQVKIAQGSKPGEGGQLPGHKVTAEIARLRHTSPGVALISPPPHHDIYSIEDLAQLIFDLRRVNPTAAVSVKLVAEAGVGLVAVGVVKTLADVVHIAGCDGGTGASPLSSIKSAGAPWELGLAETQQALVANGLRGRVRLRVDGGFKTGRDVLVAALLGADEMSFGTALLLAEGCLMVRSCHLDTCPVGIATQRPELRAKFAGTPEMIEAYLLYVAEEVRGYLAALGLRTLADAVGRVDLLRPRDVEDPAASRLDVGAVLGRFDGISRYASEPQLRPAGGELDDDLAERARPALETAALVEPTYEITAADRTVGARVSGEIGRRFGAGTPPGRIRARFRGVAGQSFGAFLAAGVELDLVGEANDYVGKSMGGGRIAVLRPENSAGEPCLIGNTALYGATGGELYCAGTAGERFAVRNSGAAAVIEGTGDHACEYMTNGTVVVLGPVGRNLGAGMTGGRAFVHDPAETLSERMNGELVTAAPLGDAEADELRALVEAHARYAGSARAAALLGDWDEELPHFRLIVPKANVAQLEDAHEGTPSAAEADDAAVSASAR